MGVTVHKRGPMFNGTAARVLREISDEISDDIAKESDRRIQTTLGTVLRNPTGYYQSNIAVKDHGDNNQVIGDRVIYGPWLEGVGSRNHTTRFKGYFTFRRIAQEMQGAAKGIAEKVVNRKIGRLR